MKNASCPYLECYFRPLSDAYSGVHLPLSVAICACGTVANCVNVMVLTDRRMRSPTNLILTSLSVAQLLLTTNYLLLQLVDYARHDCSSAAWSSTGAHYRLLNVNVSVYLHSVAFLHTLLLAVFRVVVIKYPIFASRRLIKASLTAVCGVRYPVPTAACLLLWLLVLLLCVPVIFSSVVVPVDYRSFDANNCSQLSDMFDLGYRDDPALISAIFWLFGIVFKLVPSAALSVTVVMLVQSLRSVEKKRTRLNPQLVSPPIVLLDDRLLTVEDMRPRQQRSVSTEIAPSNSGFISLPVTPQLCAERKPFHSLVARLRTRGSGQEVTSEPSDVLDPDRPRLGSHCSYRTEFSHTTMADGHSAIIIDHSPSKKQRRQHRKRKAITKPRTTRMLLTVVLLCLMVELPHGALNLMMGLYGQEFGVRVYDHFGSLLEMLTLLYSSLNFVLYCGMSTEFRQTFRRIFTCVSSSDPAAV